MKRSLFVVACCLAASLPAWAHHSFAAEFDQNQTVSLNGKVVKVEWANPHIWVYLDAANKQDAIARWQCEGGAPNSLSRNGWNRDSLKPGEVITIEGYRARDGSNTCNMRTVKTADGRTLFGASSAPAAQAP
jgi:hypothetical protein